MIRTMIEQRETNPKAIIVPKIYYYSPKNLIWYAGGHFD